MANEMILVVDADKKSQKVLEVCFKKAGYRVVLADSVVQAMRYVEQARPSLIVSETVLLDGDGLEFCADLKHNPAYKDIPFVFLTEDRSLPQKMRGFELGADDYLTKPIYIKEVTTRVELLLQKRLESFAGSEGAGDFEGDLADITMIDLLQKIEHELSSGSLLIARGTRQAIIYFRDGNLLDAVCGKLQGEDAVYRAMMWSEGRFVVRYHEHRRRVDHIEKSTEDLLMEGIHRLDEWNGLVGQLPPLDRVYALNYQQVSGQVDEFPGEVEQVVRLFDGHRSLLDVVDDSPVEDIVTLHIIGKLLDDEMLNDVTPIETTVGRDTVLDARGLNAWLASGELRDTNPGLPFSQDDLMDGEDEDFGGLARMTADREDADEVETVDLRRPLGSTKTMQLYKESLDEVLKEPSEESGSGGGHWKFHWNEDDLESEGKISGEEDRESTTGRLSGGAFGGDVMIEEPPGVVAADQVSDSIRELEARETIRREEEARRLAEQMRQIDSRSANKQLQSVPVSIGGAEDPADDDGSGVDSTQELYVQAMLDEVSEQLEDERAPRGREKTPLSTPAQMVGVDEDPDVDAAWELELGAQVSESEIRAARDAVEAVKPVMVAGEVVIETAELEAGAGFDGSAERHGQDEQVREDSEVDASESDGGDEVVERSKRVTVPLAAVKPVARAEVVEEEEQAVEEEKAVEEEVTGASWEEIAGEVVNEAMGGVSSIEEETKPEEDDAQEQRVSSAFEQVEEFEAPLFDGVDPSTTSLQSPREGEIIRATFDLSKSGLRNIRRLGGAGEVSSDVEETADVVGDVKVEDIDASGSAVEADEVGEVGDVVEEKISKKEEDAELEADKAEASEVKDVEKAASVESVKIGDSAEEDSFFSSLDDPFLESDDAREASSNWKVPVLIVGILALIVVLTWNGMKSEPEVGAPVESGEVARVEEAPVDEKAVVEPEPVVPEEALAVEEVGGLDEEQALAKAVVDSESVGESARELSESLGENVAAEAEDELVEDASAEEVVEEPVEVVEEVAEKEVKEVKPKVAVAKPAPAASAPAATTFDGKVLELRTLIKRERIGDALKLARTLSAEAPTDRSVAFLHGQAAFYDGQNNEAIEQFARAERLGMRTSALYLELGQAYQMAGHNARAKKAYETFLEIQPKGRSADEVRSILKNRF